ncbi:MAG TPA: FlgD immunoglobulin-like domain containing protein [Ferrovibrio sp.]|uniref:FlgD immunoglobulin-like domain containing protein n=1 Tax=Ferrovibrio sp. TaxID=1917215 RepID=UPI002B4AF02B|nr:FlgD immunoglobulin-like domain containing protein [Ferrovibrio sp.]HLT76278.1 FlgD immunoglobulin-like domain containing protein [Ferrovibrio sp.]
MVTSVSGTGTTQTAAENAGVSLAKNFDMFLKLLTTQLKNQDPTSPMDSKEFTNQLVQFSQVEQAINQNKNLEKLIAMFEAEKSSNLVNYIGKQVDLDSNKATLTSNSPAIWYYELPAEASSGQLRVIDKNGKIVHVANMQTQKGEHTFLWDGTVAGGMKALGGDYTLEVVAKDASGNDMQATIMTRGLVEGVERIDGVDYLLVDGKRMEVDQVLALRSAGTMPTIPQENGSYVNYIGKDVEFYGENSVCQNGSVRWSYGVGHGAADVTIKVYDSDNNLVYETTGDASKGRHDFSWDGSKSDGTTAKAGEIYKIKVEAKTADGQPVGVDVLGRGRIDSVAFENMQAMFSIGGLGVPPSWVLAVHS